MKKELMEFILAIIDKTFKFLRRMKCYFCCCNSSCHIDKSVKIECNDTCNEACCKYKNELKKSKSESSLDSLKSK